MRVLSVVIVLSVFALAVIPLTLWYYLWLARAVVPGVRSVLPPRCLRCASRYHGVYLALVSGGSGITLDGKRPVAPRNRRPCINRDDAGVVRRAQLRMLLLQKRLHPDHQLVPLLSQCRFWIPSGIKGSGLQSRRMHNQDYRFIFSKPIQECEFWDTDSGTRYERQTTCEEGAESTIGNVSQKLSCVRGVSWYSEHAVCASGAT